MPKLNREICQEHLDSLKEANEQWFYGYHFSVEDYLRLIKSMEFFEHIKTEQRAKLIAEGSF